MRSMPSSMVSPAIYCRATLPTMNRGMMGSREATPLSNADIFSANAEALFKFFQEIYLKMVTLLEKPFLLFRALGEFFQELALAPAEVLRDFNHDLDELVALPGAVEIRDAFAAHLEDGVALRAGGNPELRLALERRHLDFPAERRGRERNLGLHVQVVAPSLKRIVLPDVDDDIEISRASAFLSRLAFACDAEVGALLGSGRHFHLNLPRALHQAGAIALRALPFNGLAPAAAGAARCGGGKKAERSELGAPAAPRALAFGARFDVAWGGGA